MIAPAGTTPHHDRGQHPEPDGSSSTPRSGRLVGRRLDTTREPWLIGSGQLVGRRLDDDNGDRG